MQKTSPLKKAIVRTKLAIVAVEMTLEKLTKDTADLVRTALERKKSGDKRGAVQTMFKRRLLLRQIAKYEAMKKKLSISLDELVKFSSEICRLWKGKREANRIRQ